MRASVPSRLQQESEQEFKPDQLAFKSTSDRFTDLQNNQMPGPGQYAHIHDVHSPRAACLLLVSCLPLACIVPEIDVKVSYELSKKAFGKPMPFGANAKRLDAKAEPQRAPPPGLC